MNISKNYNVDYNQSYVHGNAGNFELIEYTLKWLFWCSYGRSVMFSS